MVTRTATLLALAATACVLPTTTTTTLNVGRTMSEVVVDHTGPLALHTEVQDSTVMVRASWPRTCHRNVLDNIETTVTRKAALVGTTNGSKWGWGLLPAMILVWPVGLAAGTVSLVAVGNSTPMTRSKRHTEVAGSLPEDCTIAATNVLVHLTLPSGAVVQGTTDETGAFVFVMADSDSGSARISAHAYVRYPHRPPGETPSTPQHAGPGQAPAAHAPSPVLETLSRTAISRARAGDCATAATLSEPIRQLDVDYHETVLVRTPAIAACLR